MKEIGNKLRLIGNNVEDLKIISAYCQDAIIKITNLVYLKKNKIFIAKLSRFMWEDLEKGVFRKYKRIDSYLRFNFIEKVVSKNIDQKKRYFSDIQQKVNESVDTETSVEEKYSKKNKDKKIDEDIRSSTK